MIRRALSIRSFRSARVDAAYADAANIATHRKASSFFIVVLSPAKKFLARRNPGARFCGAQSKYYTLRRRITFTDNMLWIDAGFHRWVDTNSRGHLFGPVKRAKKRGAADVSFSPVPQICVVASYFVKVTHFWCKITKGHCPKVTRAPKSLFRSPSSFFRRRLVLVPVRSSHRQSNPIFHASLADQLCNV
jgi:hypothetical protein